MALPTDAENGNLLMAPKTFPLNLLIVLRILLSAMLIYLPEQGEVFISCCKCSSLREACLLKYTLFYYFFELLKAFS